MGNRSIDLEARAFAQHVAPGVSSGLPNRDHGLTPINGSTKPLTGMRVIEFCHVAAGPFAAMLLGDLGADVVKVEGPHGDQMRAWPPLEQIASGGTFSHNFASVNRNKRSIQLDLKSATGRSEATQLVAEADVLIENYRPGTLSRFGLGFNTVASDHPGLVYCSISGYGQTGALASKPAYDVIIQAASGLMAVTGEEDGPPAKCGVPVADFISGLYAAYTVAALYPVSKATGKSFYIDCPMLDCLLGASALQVSEYYGSGREPHRMGSKHPRNAPYQAFRAADSEFVLAAGSDQLWQKMCGVINHPELASDPRFCDQSSRASNQDLLESILGPLFASRPACDWLRDFDEAGIPCGPVSTFGDALSSDHVRETHLVEHVMTSRIGPIPMIAFPLLIDGLRVQADRGAPMLDEHADEVRHEWLQNPAPRTR